jgi:imidazole glycerol-phosphate synthase subunit HisF
MLTRRLLACLDVRRDRVVKGRRFVDLRDVGDPAALATQYESQGVDEVVFLDISATLEERSTMLDSVRRTAESLFVPLTVGGGITSLEDVAAVLRAGADKVTINSAAVRRPALLTEASAAFGSQCIVASIDVARTGESWTVRSRGGSENTSLDAVAWAEECASRGAGEILLTSIDRDGARTGYDLELTSRVATAVRIPVIASGGAGTPHHVCLALFAGAQGALVAGSLHDGSMTIAEIKRDMRSRGLPTRLTAA